MANSVELTAEELSDDIFRVENVKTQFQFPTGKIRLTMRYSEFYKEPLDGDATVSQLKLRIDTFIQTQQLPPSDN